MNAMKILVGAMVASVVIGFGGSAGARPRDTSDRGADYRQCVQDNGELSRGACCDALGGAWVEIDNDEDGQAEDEYCEINGKPADRGSQTAPSSKPRPQPAQAVENEPMQPSSPHQAPASGTRTGNG